MNNTFKYKGFTGSIEPSIDDNCLVGEILYIQSKIIYCGDTMGELKAAFEEAADIYLDYCQSKNIQPEKPFSGSFNVRLGPELHRKAAEKAYQDGINLNELVVKSITTCIEHEILHQHHHQHVIEVKMQDQAMVTFNEQSQKLGDKNVTFS